MKLILLLMITCSLYANWLDTSEVERYLKEYDVKDVSVFVDNEKQFVSLIDQASESEYDAISQLSYIMTTFEFMMKTEKVDVASSTLEGIYYVFYYVDPHSKEKKTISSFLDKEWLINFFKVSRKTRNDLIAKTIISKITPTRQIYKMR